MHKNAVSKKKRKAVDIMGDRAQLYYMMINKKWINSVQNCEGTSTEGTSTDHRIVSLTLS